MNYFKPLLVAAVLIALPLSAHAQTGRLPSLERNIEVRATSPHLAAWTALGGLTGLTLGFGAAWAPALVSLGCTDTFDKSCGVGALGYMGFATWLTPTTTALGVWKAGDLAGGRGDYGLTLVGAVIGAVAGSPFVFLALGGTHSIQQRIGMFMAIPILQWAGAMTAYHISHRVSLRRSRRPPPVMPGLGVQRGGATLQLSGAF